MTYIIDNALIMKNKKTVRTSILIKGNEIKYIKKDMNEYSYMRMNVENYLMLPGNVMFDSTIANTQSYQDLKIHFIEKLIRKGCTNVIVTFEMKSEREISAALKRMKQKLNNSPIDYYFAIKIPLQSFTTSFLYACKRHKISVVILEMESAEQLEQFPWYWVQQAIYNYPLTLIPSIKQPSVMMDQKILLTWKKTMEKYRLSFLHSYPSENIPLMKESLMMLGIFPEKGDVRIGGTVDYCLYDVSSQINSVEEIPNLDYDNHIPTIIVHKGVILKAGSQIFYKPGVGEEKVISISKRFVPI